MLRSHHHSQDSEGVCEVLPFLITYLCKSEVSSHASAITTYPSESNAEASVKIQLSSIKPDIKDLRKHEPLVLLPMFLVV